MGCRGEGGGNPRLLEGGAKTQTSNTLIKALGRTDATQQSVMPHKLGIKKGRGRRLPSVTNSLSVFRKIKGATKEPIVFCFVVF